MAFVMALGASLGLASDALGAGVGVVLVSKSLPEATVEVIDPESGTSSGGGTTDVRLAVGDIILFRFNFFPVPDGQIHGLNGYLTEYVPPNTEVVGVRLIDVDGNTVLPRYPGLASDDCGRTCNGFNSVPSSGGTRNLDDGSIAQVYADTGVFYASDASVQRDPSMSFITFQNGILMDPPPRSVGDIASPLGWSGSGYYAHNAWDYTQVQAYGTSSAVSGNGGRGNTPYLYGSPVAGPDTHYRYEATQSGSDIFFDDVVGPWSRIQYPGSTIGTGGPASGSGTALTRTVLDASALGFDVTPATPLPSTTRSVRLAMGEVRVGEPLYAEVALRVLGTPIDPIHGRDANCAESFGGDNSGRSATVRANDNMWPFYLGSPGCVFLNLLFDLTSDRPLAVTGDDVTFSLRTKNLSTLTQTNADIVQKFDSTRVAYIGPVGGTPAPTVVADCEGDGLDCLIWPTQDFLPSEEVTYETLFDIGGGGRSTHRMEARFTSDVIPGGFGTQTINMIRNIGVVEASMANVLDPTTDFASAGGTWQVSGTVGISGSNNVDLDRYIPVLPSGWTVADTGGAAGPDITFNGTRLECASDCGTNRPEFNLATNTDAGVTHTVSFSVNVPAGTAAGVYDIELSQWASQTSYGGDYETYFRDLVEVPVGAVRTAPPVIDCPVLSTMTSVDGTSEPNADISLRFNLIERGTDTANGSGAWSATFASFGTLYGGLEITATATAPGKLESEPSARCETEAANECSDGLDNDGDGLVDFPEDPGCSSATDRDETDPQCSDGVDNDGDGDIDFPDDLGCSSPDDDSEGGTPECNDGIDNDGDGLTDTADGCCADASDQSETCFRQCNDRSDNDGDGSVDFPADLGCHSANDDDETNLSASTDVSARLLFVFDTSGSMNWNTCAADFTGGDGTLECPGNDVACSECSSTGCDNSIPDDSRIDKAKRGLTNVVAAYGEVEWGLMRFHQRAIDFACPTVNASAQSGGWQGAGAAPCGGGFNAGDLLVDFDNENQYDLLEWMDGQSNYTGGNPPAGMDYELRGSGTTPIAGSLDSALDHMSSTRDADMAAACRPYRVILITDGQETCGGDPVASATALRDAGFFTHVIGFAVADPAAVDDLNAIAAGGGTGSAIFVDDETTLSAAIADIVGDTVLVEECNGVDDDCDGLTDEGFTLYCNRPGGVDTATLCTDPGETVCDGVDDNCNGRIDEGLLNDCGTCGAAPAEVCDGVDNDCDGIIDEDDVCGDCVPEAEICDDADNDCDGIVDEDLTRVCGTDVGECTTGFQTCTDGAWGGCTGTGGTAETCDGLDNDCDGVIDSITRPCGESTGACSQGTELCTDDVWGACVGEVGPTTETCNLIDDDCDGIVDEDTGGGSCGSSIGECSLGTYSCVSGVLVCTGGTSPTSELCNNLDDDCDGLTDEAVPTDGACGDSTGECREGVRQCDGAGSYVCVGARGPTTEICDGLDNDCDGTADDGDPGGGVTCGSDEGVCSPGTTECVSGVLECTGGTDGSAELCNGLDDNCDGRVDEENPEGGASCGDTDVGECELGTMTCVSGSLECRGATGPRTEICDGLDNDCDGDIDEGNPEGGAACGDDTGECTPGTTLCTGGALICDGATEPTEEVCDGLDNDCDGVVDDGIPVGAPCGTDEGECVPGVNICSGGEIVCEGALGPVDEVCDALDNDCDGDVDEGLATGEACGMSEGLCMEGTIQCVGGRERCVGEVPPVREVCDCLDNDCDGTADEPPESGALCAGAAECIECECAVECVVSEFSPPCPTGKEPIEIDGTCWCLTPDGDDCMEEECAMETVEVDGEPRCAPDTEGAPECVCKENVCTFACDGVVCGDGLVCRASDGRCGPEECPFLPCGTGELCDLSLGECFEDPCSSITCDAGEACRLGACEPSCAFVECDVGERCSAGVCVTDACAGVDCGGTEVCDPEEGACVENMCLGVVCRDGTRCDPLTGGCVPELCYGLHCPEMELCDPETGECVPEEPPTPDGGMIEEDGGMTMMRDAGRPDFDAGPEDLHVLAGGGGGCTCTAVGAEERSTSGPWWSGLLGLALAGLLVWRRRSR